jgi:hypothetical protein
MSLTPFGLGGGSRRASIQSMRASLPCDDELPETIQDFASMARAITAMNRAGMVVVIDEFQYLASRGPAASLVIGERLSLSERLKLQPGLPRRNLAVWM